MTSRLRQTPEGGVPLAGDETVYTDDPITDALIDTVLELAAQSWVTRDRLLAIEDLLERGDPVTRAGIDGYSPSAERRADLDAQRQQFVDDVMRHLRQVTRTAHGDA